jgi:hypothetical protein
MNNTITGDEQHILTLNNHYTVTSFVWAKNDKPKDNNQDKYKI